MMSLLNFLRRFRHGAGQRSDKIRSDARLYGIRQLLQSVVQLLRSWWQQDRIRVARSSGALLRLEPGDRLLLGDQVYVVVQRRLHYLSEATADRQNEKSTYYVQRDLELSVSSVHELDVLRCPTVHPRAEQNGTTSLPCEREIDDVETLAPAAVEYVLLERSDDQRAQVPCAALECPSSSYAATAQASLIVPIEGRFTNLQFCTSSGCSELFEEDCVILPSVNSASML